MKIIKSETLLKPLPSVNWVYIEEKYSILPIQFTMAKPKGKLFSMSSRSYVFIVTNEDDQWVDVKFDMNRRNIPLVFEVPERFTKSDKPYSVLMGYNEGFLGGSFKPGFYNNREKIQYWYCLAKLDLTIPLVNYRIGGSTYYVPSVIIDMSSILPLPSERRWVYYKIGEPFIKIGDPIRIGEKHEQ